MSKIIKISAQDFPSIYEEFMQSLRHSRIINGKITFTKQFVNINRKAKIHFSGEAWVKMTALINSFSDEVAWHATAYRDDDESKDEYYIGDIFVYPQTVTGATVTTDQQRYEKWLMDLDDDTFNNLRMQGHSHVNMGVTPSAVDNTLYDGILDRLDDDMFYIFMIWNKKGDKTIMIYDFKKNILFDTADCEIDIAGVDINAFVSDARSKVTRRYSYTYGGYAGTSAYGSTYQGAYNSANTKAAATASAKTPATTTPAAKTETKTTTPPASLVSGGKGEKAKTDKQSGKRKGKRKVPKDINLYDYVKR